MAVIDGQQRLTTLQILVTTLRDRVAAFKASCGDAVRENAGELEKQLIAYTINAGVVKQEIERHKVWPTNADREAFAAVLTARSRAALDERFPPQFTGKKKKVPIPDPRRPVEAYRFFDDRVAAMLNDLGAGDDERTSKVLEAAVGALNRLMIVVIDLDEQDDAQEIFETLNFRGAPLLASDLVKNFVFGRASASKLRPDDLYDEYWRHFDAGEEGEQFWKRELVQGRLRRPVFDAFLEDYLQSRSPTPEAIASRHLYQSFKAWWEPSKDRDVEHELAELRRSSEVYRTFFEPESIRAKAPCVATFLRRMQALDTTTVYPLLLFLLADQRPPLEPEDRDAILGDFESYLVRRAVVGTSAKNLNRVFSAMIRDLRKGDAVTPIAFRDRLRQLGGVDQWPSDEVFEAHWIREPIYKRMKSRGVQMILRAVHDALVGPKQEAIVIPTDLTVEHVLPQSWATHWAPPSPTVDGADDDADARRERLLHTLGNLTLLTNALNPEASNRPYDEKRAAFTNSVLVLNRYFDKVERWDDDAIVARGRALFDHAQGIWRGPA